MRDPVDLRDWESMYIFPDAYARALAEESARSILQDLQTLPLEVFGKAYKRALADAAPYKKDPGLWQDLGAPSPEAAASWLWHMMVDIETAFCGDFAAWAEDI